MGIDIYSESGILFSLDEAVSRFFKGINASNIKKIIEDVETMIDDDSEHRNSLKNIKNCESLKSWFLELANSKINKEEGYVFDGEILQSLWDKIINYTKFKDLPEITFEYFTSNRFSGYDVPTETICIKFNDYGLFETKLTKKGQKLAEIMKIKNLKQTHWTVYSY